MRAACVLLALCLAGCSTTVRYPKRWGKLSSPTTCKAIAGTWADEGEYMGDSGLRAQSLAGVFEKLSVLRESRFDARKAKFGRENFAIRIEPSGEGQLLVTSTPAEGGKPVSKKFRCELVEGWARVSEWRINSLFQGSSGGGIGFALPSPETETERLDFRLATDGSLITRWLTRKRQYVLVIPVDDDYVRWARFKPYKPVAQSSR
jgi:hypothetical protein